MFRGPIFALLEVWVKPPLEHLAAARQPGPGMGAPFLPLLLGLLFLSEFAALASEEDPYEQRRIRMVQAIEAHAASARSALGRTTLDARVLEAMRRVPRHEFVPRWLRKEAYHDAALPIGLGQTISQPFVVALMTDLLRIESGHVVLEVGTGSGYQAAVLAHLARRVYTIEIVPDLGRAAAERLERLGYENIVTRIGDGYRGWEEYAPFDRILVTAAAEAVALGMASNVTARGAPAAGGSRTAAAGLKPGLSSPTDPRSPRETRRRRAR